MSDRPVRLFINGLSVGSGGGYTVAVQLWRHLALARPDYRVTLALTAGQKLHEEAKAEAVPANADLHWAASESASRAKRGKYEKTVLADHARQHADAVLQLNGMQIPGLRLPTLVHHQDPWPYRPEAWTTWKDPVIAFLKRRANAYALKHADCMGWTSGYLRDLVTGRLGITPKRSEVFYNGLPDDWIARAQQPPLPFEHRPISLVSVSNVTHYKRQHLVIRALPELVKKPGLGTLTYIIAGHCEPAYLAELQALTKQLGVADRVTFEGRVSDARREELVRNARVFTLMSVCESFGIPAIESMSLGTPVVTSDCCAMPEVCGDAADLCPTDDLAALTRLLEKTLLDPAHAADLQKAGAERVKHFAWTNTAAAMAKVFDELTALKRD